MLTAGDIFAFLNQKAPVARKMDFDNVGLLVGRRGASVSRVLTVLDITQEVIREAMDLECQLIVSHHPLFFELTAVSDASMAGDLTLTLAEHNIAAICMHTNLDAAEGGVNDALMAALGGSVSGILEQETGIGRVGTLRAPMAFSDFLPFVKKALQANGLRYHEAGRPVQRLAVCGGSGGGDIALAVAAGCDTYVTADVKYHQFLEAKHMGLNLIDGGHFCTENVVVPVLAGWLRNAFPTLDVRISQIHRQTEQFY